MKRKWIDRFVYLVTKKPQRYVELRNPPKTTMEKLSRPQDARQAQYNAWSKHHRVYSGSYLPESDSRLMQKGWELKKTVKGGGKIIQRKSDGQTIRSETHNQPHHYHWIDYWKRPFSNPEYRRFKNRDYGGENVYYNRYGELVSHRDPAHHLYGEKENRKK